MEPLKKLAVQRDRDRQQSTMIDIYLSIAKEPRPLTDKGKANQTVFYALKSFQRPSTMGRAW